MFTSEIERSKVLQWALGALVFIYFVFCFDWIPGSGVTKTAVEGLRYVCPPYFQSCEMFYVLDALPFGYSQTILYMAILGILAWSVYLMSERAWGAVQLSLMPIFFWHAANTLLFTDYHSGNYEYYVLIFGLILLFLPHKEFFLKLIIVLFYVLSTLAKIHPSWIEGGYFTALRTGLPFFPDWSIPLFTNLVIIMEMVGAWFLMSRNTVLQRGVLSFFILFHLYSGILVEYRYPATVLPFVLILFGPWFTYTPVPLDRKSIIGWMLIALLLVLQISPKLIPGDEKMTLEGNKYGLYMFEANHQCFSEARVHMVNGSVTTYNRANISARIRCSPYTYWFPMKKLCERNQDIARIEWKFSHSINAGPFYQIVDVENACTLSYNAFGRNTWIQTPDEAEIIGYPVRNIYH